MVLTAVLLLAALWQGMALLLLSEPDPIMPAEATLKFGDFATGVKPAPDGIAVDLVSRPLFWAGRAAYTPQGVETAPVSAAPVGKRDKLENVKLLGVYGSGKKAGVILSYGGEQQRLKLDQSVDGWTLAGVDEDGAHFEADGEVSLLPLEHAAPGAAKSEGRKSGSKNGRGEKRPSKSRDSKSGDERAADDDED